MCFLRGGFSRWLQAVLCQWLAKGATDKGSKITLMLRPPALCEITSRKGQGGKSFKKHLFTKSFEKFCTLPAQTNK